MSEDSTAQSSLGRRLFIAVRVAAAWLMWANIAIVIGMMKAQAGIPANSPEWNKTWEDYRRWALNPPATILTPTAKMNLKYGLPAGFAPFLGIPIRVLTDRAWLIVVSGIVICAFYLWLSSISYRKAKALGDQSDSGLGLWGSLAIGTFVFSLYYSVLVLITGAVVGG